MGPDNSVCDSIVRSSDFVSRVAFHNGRWVDAARVALSVRDPAITQAVTAVERLRAYQGVLFQRSRHFERWERTTGELSIDDLPKRPQLSSLLDELLRRNQTWISATDLFGVVMFASPGEADGPTLVIDLYPIDQAMVTRRVEFGSPVVITSVQQPPNASWSRNIKVRCRLHYYLADRQARRADPDAIGLLVDSDGTVTESGVANVVIVEDGRLVSPPSDQILCGVSLQVLRDLAARLGLEWCEQRIAAERFRSADEILLTGTSCGIWFAKSIDGSHARPPGRVYRELRAAFEELTVNSGSNL